MSLRIRLALTIASIVLLSLVAGGDLAWRHAVKSVHIEMSAALEVGRHVVEGALARTNGSTDLPKVVAMFDRDRHLRARLLSEGGEVLASSSLQPPRGPPPSWFAGILHGSEWTVRLPVPSSSFVISLTTDPTNEIGEVWGELTDAAGAIAVLGILTLTLVYWTLGRALRPLQALSDGFAGIGGGDYSIRVAEEGPPELAELARAFNDMTARLAQSEARNRRLDEQISTIQEEERAELARDLHDDVGPYLLAINIDASRIAGRSKTDGELLALVRSIQESIGHIQKQVRAILARLRPVGLDELGLIPGLQALVAFWRNRHPATEISLETPNLRGFSPALDDVVYRLVRESLGNAIRHGEPSMIAVAIRFQTPQTLYVEIRDDGGGLPPSAPIGFGLRGMAERVASIGGTLNVSNRIDAAGVIITATLPYTAAEARLAVVA